MNDIGRRDNAVRCSIYCVHGNTGNTMLIPSIILCKQTPTTDLVDPSRGRMVAIYIAIPASLCSRFVGCGVCPEAWTWSWCKRRKVGWSKHGLQHAPAFPRNRLFVSYISMRETASACQQGPVGSSSLFACKLLHTACNDSSMPTIFVDNY